MNEVKSLNRTQIKVLSLDYCKMKPCFLPFLEEKLIFFD